MIGLPTARSGRVLLCGLFLTQLAAESAAAGNERPGQIRRVRIKGGPLLVMMPEAGAPRVAVQALLPGGLRLENENNNGVHRLLASLLGLASEGLPAEQMAQELGRLDGRLIGESGTNFIGLGADFPAPELPRALELICGCLRQPSFPAAEVARARRRLLRQIAAAEDNPSAQAFALLVGQLFQKHAYRLSPLGRLASIARLDGQRLAEYWKTIFHSRRLVIAVVGGASVKEAAAALKLHCQANAPPPPPIRVALEPPVSGGRRVEKNLAGKTAAAWLGFLAASVHGSDRDALEVLLAVLAGPAGRLRRSLPCAGEVEVSAIGLDGVEPGFVAFGVTADPARLEQALEWLREQIERIAREPPAEDELCQAKGHLQAEQASNWQRPAGRAKLLALAELYGLGYRWVRDFEKRIEKVSAEQVAAAAASYLRLDRSVTAIVK